MRAHETSMVVGVKAHCCCCLKSNLRLLLLLMVLYYLTLRTKLLQFRMKSRRRLEVERAYD